MSNMTRQRGRPVGTQINDDPTLTKMVDLIAVNPALRPTTAIRRVLAAPGPSIIRRLQVKWKNHGAGQLVDAKAGLDARKALEVSHQLAEAQLKASAMFTAREALRGCHESHAMRALWEFHNSPTMKALREMQDSPARRMLYELQNSPAMRAIRAAQNSSLMQAAETLNIGKWRTYSASVGRLGSSRG